VRYMSELFQLAQVCRSRFATSPASLAWELTPWSFLADWFVDVRGFLNKLDASLGFDPWETVSFTKSVTYELENGCDHATYSPCNGGPMTSVGYARARYRHYERLRVSPSVLPSWKPRFGKTQAGILAALISQKLSSRR
jgi:hypothetical protein